MPVLSLTTAAVSPAAVLPRPLVYRPRGAILAQNLSISDFAVPGSPTRNMLMSPRTLEPSGICLWVEPTTSSIIASLMVSCSVMWGANESTSLS